MGILFSSYPILDWQSIDHFDVDWHFSSFNDKNMQVIYFWISLSAIIQTVYTGLDSLICCHVGKSVPFMSTEIWNNASEITGEPH